MSNPGRLTSILFLVAVLCRPAVQAQSKTIPITIRDFNASHADFQEAKQITCDADGVGMKGMVDDTLDAAHKPVKSATSGCPKYDIHTWFRDDPTVNRRYCLDLPLDKIGNTANTYQTPSAFAQNYFPIDSVVDPNPPNARIKAPDPVNPAMAGETFAGGSPNLPHNFHFCMEMHATFKYRGGEVFDFKGDDDVWVFINNRLALDLGGLQNNGSGQVNLDLQKDALKISTDNYYNFDFFFCERQTTGSHLQVSTSIDIIPPPTVGVHIADASLNVYRPGDTITLDQASTKVFKAVKIENQVQTLDCNNLTSQIKSPAQGSWTFDNTALPDGSEATVNTAGLAPGRHKLLLTKDGFRDSVWILVTDTPPRILPKALSGYYEDRDGDGRIETAVLVFDEKFTVAPKEMKFIDPFDRTSIQTVTASVPGPAGSRSIVVTLQPFTPGTGFATDILANISAEADFAAQGVSMADSVGPVVKSVKSISSATAGQPASVEIEFSEPVPLDVAAAIFPLEIKRGMGLVDNGQVKVESMVQISPSRYRIVFAADSKYPVAGDSARIAPARPVKDGSGNLSDMRYFIPVTGDPPRANAQLSVGLVEGVTDGPLPISTGPVLNPVIVHGKETCLNCGNPDIIKALPTLVPREISAIGPTWRVMTKFPFEYSMKFYDNLGNFVNKADGKVGPDDFEKLRATEKVGDSVLVELTFLPLAHGGSIIGTGAYIMRGVLKIQDQQGLKGSQGETITLVPVERSIISRFGFIRSR